MRKVIPVFLILSVMVFALVAAAAQAPQGAGQGRGQAAAPAKPVGVDAATAKKMIAAAEAAALAAQCPGGHRRGGRQWRSCLFRAHGRRLRQGRDQFAG